MKPAPRITLSFAIVSSLIVLAGCATTGTESINRQPGAPVKLIVHFSGVEDGEGRILAFIHDSAGSYHSDDDTNSPSFSAFRFTRVTPSVPVTTVVFDAIPAGRYAVSGYQDKDGDGALDRMLLPFPGMPSEPYGIANDAWAIVSKPAFADALIDAEPPVTEITIKLSTHLRKFIE